MSEPRDDAAVEALLRLAGPGPGPDAEAAARARAAVHSAWRHALRTRRRRRLQLLGGALLAAGVAVVLRPDRPALPARAAAPVVVATVERALDAAIPVGRRLAAGAALDTGGGRLALRTTAGASLRLDARTRLLWRSASHAVLVRGALYFDSAGSHTRFVLDTPQGRVTDAGTLYEARLLDDARLRLRVREGGVRLDTARGVERAAVGEELSVLGGRVERGRVALAGPDWGWAEKLAVAPPIDGRPLAGFLEWAARERGLGLHFADAETRARASGVRLHGSVAGLTPAEALDAIAPTTGLRVRRNGDRLTVESAR